MKITSNIIAIIKDGANVKVSSKKTTSDLREIVQEARRSGTTVIISGANSKITSDLRAIARDYPKGVTFEFDT